MKVYCALCPPCSTVYANVKPFMIPLSSFVSGLVIPCPGKMIQALNNAAIFTGPDGDILFWLTSWVA